MAKLAIKPGSTSQTVYVFVPDSASTTGGGKTGIAYNAASLTAYYVRVAGSATQITLATQTVTGAYSSGGWVEVDATNMPGLYRLDLPDAVLAAGVRSAVVYVKGASGMAPVILEIDLSNQADAVSLSGTACTARDIGASVLLSSGTGTGQVSLSSGKVAATLASTDVTGNVAADLQTIKTQTVTCAGGVTIPAATLASTANITTVGAVSGAVGSVTGNVGGNVVGSVASVTAGVTVTTNNDKTGYSLSTTPPTSAEIADKILGRAVAGGADGGRTVTQALQVLRNKVAIVGGTMTVYAADDTTTSWTAAITTTAGNPITTVDPA